MPRVKIEGVGAGVDGEYEFDMSSFTGREWHTVKKISGVRAGEVLEALQAGDYDLLIAFTKIALERNGKAGVPVDVLLDAPAGKIALIADEEVDARPPSSPPLSGLSNDPAASGDASASGDSSGPSSRNGGDQQASHPSPTGPRLSATGSA